MTEKVYEEQRFEFALYVNDNLVCKRNFKINNFIEGSMQSIEFKELVDSIVNDIDTDLKSKSRVYTWYYGDVSDSLQQPLDEFNEPLIDDWESTFKFIITDNKRPVIERIWDGKFYPRAIREKVDIANKFVKFTTKDGRTYTYDKESYFRDNDGKLTPEMYCLKGMIYDKPDLLGQITRKICEICSPRDNGFKKKTDYTFAETYKNDKVTKANSKRSKAIKYTNDLYQINNKVNSIWGSVVAEKTKAYYESLY